jgi:hypothetical protein
MNNIILVDDDASFRSTFINEAGAKKINVSPQSSLEGLKKILPALAHKYAAVVLDIKCLLTENQAKEEANFIGAALHYIDTEILGFPRFILTGDETEFESLKKYYPKEKMFLKNPSDQASLFKELEECIKNAEPIRLRRENPAVFEVFTKALLDVGKEPMLLNILKRYNEINSTHFKGILGDIREIHEEIYRAINKRNKSVVPNKFINGNNSPIFGTAFYKHLEGNLDPTNSYKPTTTPYQDSTISSMTKFIHSACSENLHGTSKTKYLISPYSVKALINSLLELIVWSTKY